MGEGSLAKPAGNVAVGSSAGGSYMFADLAELDDVIARWTNVRDGVQADGRKLLQAQQLIQPPAQDFMSRLQPLAMSNSLDKALEHNAAMAAYAEAYVQKLQAARAQYAVEDEESVERMRHVDGG